MSEVLPLSRRLLAESLGSTVLVATVVGSGIMAERLFGGDQAVALARLLFAQSGGTQAAGCLS
jgi:glycerol uptake facilitator-like aquaporin